jgi:hypothetical protein
MRDRDESQKQVVVKYGKQEIGNSPLEFIRRSVKETGGNDQSSVLCSFCGGFEPVSSENLTIIQIHIPDEPEYDWYPTHMIDHNRMATTIVHAHHFPLTHNWMEDVYIPPPKVAKMIVEGGW